MSFFKKYDLPEEEEEINLLNNLDSRKEEVKKQKIETDNHKSILFDDVQVTGDLYSQKDIIIYGQVKGNIVCEGDLLIEADTEANIKGFNAIVRASKIEGNINCEGNIELDFKSEVFGNVTGSGLQMDGKVNGNITVNGLLQMQKNAEIHGDAIAAEISIQKGALLDGRVTMIRK